MDVRNFLSDSDYVVLPTKLKPKVYLPIDNAQVAGLAFELYNPFSGKAKFLKSVIKFLSVHLNPIAKLLLPTIKGQKSSFITLLEQNFKKKVTTSVYLATQKDKVVLQLQNQTEIIGYLKYPVSEIGKKRLANEGRAITILSKLKLLPPLVLSATHENSSFFVLQNLKGVIGQMEKQEYTSVLNKLKKQVCFELKEHPRIIALQKRLNQHQWEELKINFEKVLDQSNKKYLEVFEHGDFAPWNLIKTANGTIPFDFEYFEEHGLEHLDEIKYHFQEQHLLHHKTGEKLIQGISSKVGLEEFGILLHVFLVKEIVNKLESSESYELEKSLLNIIARNQLV